MTKGVEFQGCEGGNLWQRLQSGRVCHSPQFFGSFFGCRCHVVEPGEEAAGLGCDDGYRKSPSEMMEDETLFRI